MRKMFGLKALYGQKLSSIPGVVMQVLAQDLQFSQLIILGRTEDVIITLAHLYLAELNYDSFDKRLDLVFEGSIVAENTPLTYELKGAHVMIRGRCSILKRVCGVDLYLNSTYTAIRSDCVRQKISIYYRDVLKASD